jgi:SAM-dependent methyltransferase
MPKKRWVRNAQMMPRRKVVVGTTSSGELEMTVASKLLSPSQLISSGADNASINLEVMLASLYRDHCALHPPHPYILEHQKPACIANQVRTFQWYRPYLPPSGSVLDWGCYHSPDACMLRAWYGDRFELHGCDFADRDAHRVFHDFSGCDYRQLDDCVELPYPSAAFDAVIASGTLEHTAMDYESLKELHRVLKPDGVLIISYLPNSLSVREWIQRNVHKKDFHRRLYGASEAIQLLKRSGFYPATMRYHTFFWERIVEKAGLGYWRDRVAGALSKLLPLQTLSSTHCCIANKVKVM